MGGVLGLVIVFWPKLSITPVFETWLGGKLAMAYNGAVVGKVELNYGFSDASYRATKHLIRSN